MKRVDAAKRDRSHGVAVVGLAQPNKAGTGARGRHLLLLPVLKRELESDLHGSRTLVTEEDAGETRRRDRDQFLSHCDGRFTRQTQQGGVGNLVQLFVNRVANRWVIVPV